MVKPPSPESEITCRTVGADEAALAVHREIARGPDDRQADVGREDCVVGRLLVDDAHDVLRVQEAARSASRQLVEALAGLDVVLPRRVQMTPIALDLDAGDERAQRSP